MYFQTLFSWGQKGELSISYYIQIMTLSKDLKTKIVLYVSLVIGQIWSLPAGNQF